MGMVCIYCGHTHCLKSYVEHMPDHCTYQPRMGTGSGSGLASGGRFPNIVIYRYLPTGPDEGALSTDRAGRRGVIYRYLPIGPGEGALSTRHLVPATPWRPSLSRLSPSKLFLLKLPCSQSASAAQAATRAAWRRAQGVAGFKRASPTSHWVQRRPCSAASAPSIPWRSRRRRSSRLRSSSRLVTTRGSSPRARTSTREARCVDCHRTLPLSHRSCA